MPAFNLESNFINTGYTKLLNKKLEDSSTLYPVFISPLYGSSKAIFISQVNKKTNQMVVLLPDNNSIKELNVELNILGVSKKIILIDDFNSESIQEKLTQVINNESHLIISTYGLLRLELPLPEMVENSTTKIQIGNELSFEEIVEYLNLLNYQKEKFVEAQGSYSQRGSIIDFWSYSEHNPIRLEFDGDFLESIRYFDPDSQRSIDVVNEVTLAGSFTETLVSSAKSEGKSEEKEKIKTTNSSSIFDYLKNPLVLASEYNLNNTSNGKIKLFDVSAEEENKINEIKNEESFNINEFKKVRWVIEQELRSSEKLIDLGISEPFSINGNYKILSQSLIEYASSSYTIIITSENELQTQRLKDLLSELDENLASLITDGKIKFISLAIKEG